MRVLLDTNVVLDVLLRRGQWLADAEAVWRATSRGQLTACITASSLTDIYYISRRLASLSSARQVVRQCLDCLELLPVDGEMLEQAYALHAADFEDALQIAAAMRGGLDAIVTRDPKGFSVSQIRVLSPSQLTARMSASE